MADYCRVRIFGENSNREKNYKDGIFLPMTTDGRLLDYYKSGFLIYKTVFHGIFEIGSIGKSPQIFLPRGFVQD